MKKRLLALLMAGVLTFSLTACGSGNKTQESNQTGTEQQVVTQDTTEEAKDIAEMSFDEMKEEAKGTKREQKPMTDALYRRSYTKETTL